MMLQTDFVAMELRLQRDTGKMIAIAEDVQRTYKTVSGLHVYRHKYLYRDVCLICAWTGTLVLFLFTFICCPNHCMRKEAIKQGRTVSLTGSQDCTFNFDRLFVVESAFLAIVCVDRCGTRRRYLDGAICHTWSILGKSTSTDMEYTRLRCERERSHHCIIICNYL